MNKQLTLRTVSSGDETISYSLERKPVKNLNLRIRVDGTVYVSASEEVSAERIDQFILRKKDYILRNIRQFQSIAELRQKPKEYVSGESFYYLGHGLRLLVIEDERNCVTSDGVYLRLYVNNSDSHETKQKLVDRFFDQQRRTVFSDVIDEIHPVFRKYGVCVPSLRIRDMETRWGSCLAKKGIITLNKRLIEVPRHCIEYVITHEMCHFVHPNHSKQFYEFLSMLMPDWRERKKTLDQYALYWL